MNDYTSLDSLKELFWVAMNALDVAQECLADAMDPGTPEDVHDVDPLLESVKGELVRALARHVPGIQYMGDGFIEYDGTARLDALTNDDGTLIKIPIESTNGYMRADYFPRRDGSRWPFEESLNAQARIAEANAIEYERTHPHQGA